MCWRNLGLPDRLIDIVHNVLKRQQRQRRHDFETLLPRITPLTHSKFIHRGQHVRYRTLTRLYHNFFQRSAATATSAAVILDCRCTDIVVAVEFRETLERVLFARPLARHSYFVHGLVITPSAQPARHLCLLVNTQFPHDIISCC